MRTSSPVAAARRSAQLLPAAPGVYRFTDAGGRVLYLGRATSLRQRVSSYWGDLAGREHLAAMVRSVATVQAVPCASVHEAALLERSLLEDQLPPWNLTAGGQESELYIRLDRSARSAGLAAVYQPRPGRDLRYFGPYLGGRSVRLAVAALGRVFGLHATATGLHPAARELAASRGLSPADRAACVAAVTAVLEREPAAVAALAGQLAARRDAAAASESYELAGRIQNELAACTWITSPQQVAVLTTGDADACGWSGGILTRFQIRSGRIRGWQQLSQAHEEAAPALDATPAQWREFAQRAAVLAARLA